MAIHDRHQREEVDQLVDEYTRDGMSRRAFLQRAVAIGLTSSAAVSLLAACGGGGGTSSTPKSVDLIATWGGSELDAFTAAKAPFEQQTGIKVNVESTRDLNATLTTRIQGNNPPDIAVLPNPGKMQQLAKQGHLISLEDLGVDVNKVKSQYSSTVIDLGSYNGKVYSILYKGANKGTVWYNPQQFQSNGYATPSTWDDLITLSDKIAGSGKYPWSMGVSSGAASGWPAADWIDQIFLAMNGPDLYDQWVNHKIPWTHSAVKNAWQYFGQIAHGKHYINGAPQSILATGFQDATYAPFKNPPAAYMYYLGDFAAGFITGQFSGIQAGTGYNYFPFPTINPQYPGAVTGGADLVTAFKNNGAVKQLVQYLATAQPQQIWIQKGGFTSLNKTVDPSVYPDALSKALAQQLASAAASGAFRFGADDLMPSQVEDAFWAGTLTYIQDASKLDSVLSGIESTASSAYGS